MTLSSAFPLRWETGILVRLVDPSWAPQGLVARLDRVHEGLTRTGDAYPFIAYGTNWLAFAL